MFITGHAEVRAVLSDPSYVPPPVAAGAEPGTLGWLRARVSRFAAGPAHAERRALVEARLAVLDPAALRTAAAETTRTLLTGPAAGQATDMATDMAADMAADMATSEATDRTTDMADRVLAHGVPTRVLGPALGVACTDALVSDVATVAGGYLSGVTTPEIDAAVAALAAVAGIPEITILLQAHGATTALLRNAIARPPEPLAPDDLLRDTLRHDPPVRATKRVDATGALVEVDLTPDLAFGHGPRRCPGSGHAMAIATGVLETIMEFR
ncbi:hypothetical protein [Nonomuraea sp. NPDC003804]|uniref:hypothetical protein n=1 Tax=Nonomuraea sp. NPDC003804 TaxID=3154547 RepID=UPI0033B6BD58